MACSALGFREINLAVLWKIEQKETTVELKGSTKRHIPLYQIYSLSFSTLFYAYVALWITSKCSIDKWQKSE